MTRTTGWRLGFGLILIGAMTVGPAALAQRGGQALSGDMVREVRLALGHGDLASARRIAAAGGETPASRALARALVDIFEGQMTEARERLLVSAQQDPLGEASLELGLLDLATGRREDGRVRLEALAAVRQFSGPDDYFRLARAARAIREGLLANDAYQRTAEVPRADIQTAWGDLFLLWHQPADAAVSYQAALDADPRWIRAHLGLARALVPSEPEAAAIAVDRAGELAPDHPDVWLLMAERAMSLEDVEGAVEALDRLADVRPGTIEEASLRAAVAYAEARLDEVEPAIARAAALNLRSALPLRRVGEEVARDYRFADAAVFAERATLVDPDDPEAFADLGLYLLRTGDEADARDALEWAWSLDKSNQRTFNLLNMLDKLDQFVVVEQGDLVFKFSPEEAEVLKAYAVPLGQAAYETFVERYGFTPEGPILIEIFDVHDDFAVRTLGLPGLVGALGACFGRVVSMDSPRARPPGSFSWQATLWHEMAHVFTLQMSDYRVPRWLTEGVSGYEEHRRRAPWGRELTLEYAHELARERTFGVTGLPDAFKRPESLALAYFEASLVVEHLVAEHGEAGLSALLRAYGEGLSDTEAFVRAFGEEIDTVDASFQQFVEQRYGALSMAMAPPPSTVEFDDLEGLRQRADAAPANFVSQLAYGQALVSEGDFAGARGPLERAAALAPEASGSASPRALLARMAEQGGDLERARTEWRELLAWDHTNVVGARRLAELAAAAGDDDDLEYALRFVADLDPFDAESHGQLGRRLFAAGDHGAALIEFEAALAVGPPNVAEAHADLAEVLLMSGRREEARREALAALKVAPSYARAQDLLLLAIGRDR
jgi:tetratricopeptide (TPR) repeat protein